MLALLAIRARIAGAPAPAHGPLYEGAVYTGALLGVRARVELGVDRDFAEVALSGTRAARRRAARPRVVWRVWRARAGRRACARHAPPLLRDHGCDALE